MRKVNEIKNKANEVKRTTDSFICTILYRIIEQVDGEKHNKVRLMPYKTAEKYKVKLLSWQMDQGSSAGGVWMKRRLSDILIALGLLALFALLIYLMVVLDIRIYGWLEE